MNDPTTISVLLSFPAVVVLVLAVAWWSGWFSPLGRFFYWLIHDAGRWGL